MLQSSLTSFVRSVREAVGLNLLGIVMPDALQCLDAAAATATAAADSRPQHYGTALRYILHNPSCIATIPTDTENTTANLPSLQQPAAITPVMFCCIAINTPVVFLAFSTLHRHKQVVREGCVHRPRALQGGAAGL